MTPRFRPTITAAAALVAVSALAACQQATPTAAPPSTVGAPTVTVTPSPTVSPTPTKSADRIAAEEMVIASQDAFWRTMMGHSTGEDWPKYMRNTRENGTKGYLQQASSRAASALSIGLVAQNRAAVTIIQSTEVAAINGLPTVEVQICEDDSGLYSKDAQGREIPYSNSIGPVVMTVQNFSDGWRATEFTPGKGFTC